jgi:hypothetical protein
MFKDVNLNEGRQGGYLGRPASPDSRLLAIAVLLLVIAPGLLAQMGG